VLLTLNLKESRKGIHDMSSPTLTEDLTTPPLTNRLPPTICSAGESAHFTLSDSGSDAPFPPGLNLRRSSDGPPSRDLATRLIAMLAAVTITASSASLFVQDSLGAMFYSTHIGQRKAIKLDDGSVITLNTNSSLKIRHDGPMLSVQIFQGEAHFNMLPDPRRHLVVSVGDQVKVIDTATVFDVRVTDEDKTQVTVQEGQVQLVVTNQADVQLHQNQQATVDSDSSRLSIHTHNLAPKEIERQFSWLQGYLDFQCATVADAAQEFNRYNLTRIEVDDHAGLVQIGGVFLTTDPVTFAESVAKISKTVRLNKVDGPADTQILQLRTRDKNLPPETGCTAGSP
jgi:ferric-dicitrate binding protein FerR (iron transport regulator)